MYEILVVPTSLAHFIYSLRPTFVLASLERTWLATALRAAARGAPLEINYKPIFLVVRRITTELKYVVYV